MIRMQEETIRQIEPESFLSKTGRMKGEKRMKKKNLKRTSTTIIAALILAAQLFSALSVFGPRAGGAQTFGVIEEDIYCAHRF